MYPAEDHRAVITALYKITRPVSVSELAELAGLAPFVVRACLEQICAHHHAMAFGARLLGEDRYQLTARGYADLIYDRSLA